MPPTEMRDLGGIRKSLKFRPKFKIVAGHPGRAVWYVSGELRKPRKEWVV